MVRKFEKILIEEQEKLLMEFCEAFLSMKNVEEASNFLTDLLTKKEILILTKRIKIAKYLLNGKKYREIEEMLKVSHGTVAKIAEWLVEGGEGFKMMTERTKKQKVKVRSGFHKKIKKKYSAYFWPELLIKDIMITANKKQKEKIKKAIENLDRKSVLYKKLKNS